YDRFKKLDKQKSTYLISMIERAESDLEQRIYTELLLHGTNSGRLSSRKPNLQNITRTKSDLPDIRGLFRSSNGRRIVSADYSPYGRVRRFYLLTPENLQASYREGINFYPQSTASDFTLFSAGRLHENIDLRRAAIILLVHDSILADVCDGYVDEYNTICKQ